MKTTFVTLNVHASGSEAASRQGDGVLVLTIASGPERGWPIRRV